MVPRACAKPKLSVHEAAGLLGQHNSITSNEIIEGGVLAAMLSLICSAKHKSQLAGLQVLASLALVSNTAAQKLMSQRLLAALQVRLLTHAIGMMVLIKYYTSSGL